MGINAYTPLSSHRSLHPTNLPFSVTLDKTPLLKTRRVNQGILLCRDIQRSKPRIFLYPASNAAATLAEISGLRFLSIDPVDRT
jgi:hypothetical protein